MQAISTKYFGPTNFSGSRIKAECDAGSVTIVFPQELSGSDAHRKAAEALAKKLGWDNDHYGRMICGSTKTGYVFVFDRN